MERLFTIVWPDFARIEAVAVYAMLATVVHAAAKPVVDLGPIELWGICCGVVLVPFVIMMVLVDRLLAIRKGFAWVSILAIGFWSGAAASMAYDLTWLPLERLREKPWTTVTGDIAIVAACLAFLVHAKPLLLGLEDQGFIGMGLAAKRSRRAEWWQRSGD
jgi:hypothetical protein